MIDRHSTAWWGHLVAGLVLVELVGWIGGPVHAVAVQGSYVYQGMQSFLAVAAHTNLARLASKLTLRYHTACQHGITMEMLDLVSRSGVL